MEKVKRRRGYTRVSPKHQVTLPVDAMTRAGVRAGDRLRVTARETGEIVLELADDPVEAFAGALTGIFPAGYMDRIRDEWR